MKKAEIKQGGHYKALVSGKLVTVRVTGIRQGGEGTRYDVTNLSTGRKTTFRSAAKFRSPAKAPPLDIYGKPTTEENFRKIVNQECDEPPVKVSAKQVDEYAAHQECDGVAESNGAEEPKTGLGRLLKKSIEAVESRKTSTDLAPHLIVEARAGTGKTTTLICGLQVIRGEEPHVMVPSPLRDGPPQKKIVTPSPQQAAVWEAMELSRDSAKFVCFVAFNKAIAMELQQRVPVGCDAMTMHSMGYRAVQKGLDRQEPNSFVVQDIIAELMERDIREIRKYKPEVLKATESLVGLCKQNLVGYNRDAAAYGFSWDEELDKLASYYDIDLNSSRSEVFDLVPRVLERCKEPKGKIHFDDMIWLPVVLKLPVFKYDLLLVDEAQDLNRAQQQLALMAGKRLVLCGDPKQAIYGFAGADADSMPRMAETLGATPQGCTLLPLTVTRRCGKAIVAEAQKIVPDFEAFETNLEGLVNRAPFKSVPCSSCDSTGVWKYPQGDTLPTPQPRGQTKRCEDCNGGSYINRIQDGDMALCRVNAPLVSECFKFLKAGRKATIQGRDVGQGLISTVKKMKAESVVDLVSRLSDWVHAETTKENAKRNPSEQRVIALQDRYDCLVCFTEGAKTVEEVTTKIEAIFTDDKKGAGIKFSSIHKAKGLESRRVFLLEPAGATVPHPMAKSAWQKGQELNLRYVAITRAIEELVYVN